MLTLAGFGRAFAVGLTLAACGGSGGSGSDGGTDAAPIDAGVDAAPHTLVALAVTPTDPLVELDLGATGARAFSVTGTYLDGVPEDLTGQVTWTVERPEVGAMNGATLAIPAFATTTAVTSRVTATLGALSGQARITVVAYRRSGPDADDVLLAPYQAAEADERELTFAAELPALDVLFLMDTTGTMYGAINAFQAALATTLVPGVRADVADSRFGVAAFEDFPVLPYGSLRGSDCGRGGLAVPDQPFLLFQAITDDPVALEDGAARLRTGTGPIGCGQDWPDSTLEALYQAATGEGLTGPGPTAVPANHTGVGGAGFRPGAVRVIVPITDALTHGPGEAGTCPSTGEAAAYAGAVATAAHSRDQTKAALGAICARVVGVAPLQAALAPECSSDADLTDLATASGARVPPGAWGAASRPFGCAANQCCTGLHEEGEAPDADGLCPLRLRTPTSGAELAAGIGAGLRLLARNGLLDVGGEVVGGTTDVDGVALPAPHTTADFLAAVIPASSSAPPAGLPGPTLEATRFHNVTPGLDLTFTARATNDFLPGTDDVRLFRATVRATDGCTALDEREVLIVVPPAPLGD